jgi:hypothetical protein
LDIVIHRIIPTARAFGLPDAYTRIFDAPGQRGVIPIIEHFQASRRFRRKIIPIVAPSGGPFSMAQGRRFK